MTRSAAFGATVLVFTVAGLIASPPAEQSAAQKEFQKLLYDRIGTEWYNRIQNHADELLFGVVRVKLTLARDGTIRNLRLVSNTSKQRLSETVVLDSIRCARIPPPPPELLKHGVFKTDLSFKVYQN
jgi:outer membrane biosynthesis protein TonB